MSDYKISVRDGDYGIIEMTFGRLDINIATYYNKAACWCYTGRSFNPELVREAAKDHNEFVREKVEDFIRRYEPHAAC